MNQASSSILWYMVPRLPSLMGKNSPSMTGPDEPSLLWRSVIELRTWLGCWSGWPNLKQFENSISYSFLFIKQVILKLCVPDLATTLSHLLIVQTDSAVLCFGKIWPRGSDEMLQIWWYAISQQPWVMFGLGKNNISNFGSDFLRQSLHLKLTAYQKEAPP